MRPHQRLLTELVAPRVDLVIAVSERQKAPLERLGYRADRIAAVPNGVFDARRGRAGRPPADAPRAAARRGRFRGAVRVQPAPREGVRRVHRGGVAGARARAAVARPGGRRRPRARAARGAGRRARRSPHAGRARGRARPDRRLRRALPAQRRGGAADEHPRGDGARPAGGDHRRGRDAGGRDRRRDRRSWWRPGTAARPRRRSRAWRPTRSGRASWARAGANASAALPRRRDGGRLPARARAEWPRDERAPGAPVDILLLSLGTTLGWRVGDSLLLEQLRAAGVTAPRCRCASAPAAACGAPIR